MSKINPAKLTLEDFQSQREWISPLFSILNTFTGDVIRGFSNQITIEDNLFQETKEVKWKNAATDYPLKFRAKFNSSPKGLMPIYLFDTTDGVYSPNAPWIEWGYSDGSISISNVSGLTADHMYVMRLLVIYG